MLSRNIPLYTLDFTGKKPENLVEGEYYRKADTSLGDMELNDVTFVLRSGPFYTESLILTKPNGELLIEGKHYELFGIATALTAFIKDKEVGMFVNIIDETVTEWFARYQVVGHFGIMNQDLVNLVNTAVNDDRPILYKNLRHKPLWFNPELHVHDLRYGIHSFQGLVEGIKSLREYKGTLQSRESIAVEQFNKIILERIDDFEAMLLRYIRNHDAENVAPYGNSHGLTAKQMKLENVDNFDTASLLDVLDGFRKDKHITVDLVKRVIDQIGKDTDNLIKVGTLPILSYNSTNFIPSPITGSFEGMGGTDFNVGVNIESDGSAVLLMNRNDGRVNNLYFMQNKETGYPNKEWNFTAFKYTHQTAEADGVTLRNVLRGSNGKFLVIGGPDASGKQVWYYALGNGTFDSLKHKLIRIPDDVPVAAPCFLCTEAFPHRVLLFRRYTQSETVNNATYRNQGFDLPLDTGSLPGASFNSAFGGLGIWEFNVSDLTWRRATLNYNQCGETTKITSDVFMPFRTVVTAITDANPRADGKKPSENYKYGISAYEYKFTKPISYWDMRAWYDIALDQYDELTDKLYLKYWYTAYGSDTRPNNYEGGTCAIGFILKNRTLKNGVVSYDIENRKGLTEMYTLDTAVLGANVNGNIVEGVVYPHSEWVPAGYAGTKTQAWLGKKRFFSIGSQGYGTFPVVLTLHDLNGLGSIENIDNWVNGKLTENLAGAGFTGNAYAYNEKSPAGLTIGAHSTFWLQLDPTNPNTYGAVSYSNLTGDGSLGLWFRKQPALDNKGYPTIPDKVYKLYEALNGGKETLGYGLDNTVYPILNRPETTFVTNIFVNASNNRKTQYIKHLVGHQPFPEGKGGVTNTTAVTKVSTEWEVVREGAGYRINPTKTYDLDDAIKKILIPHVSSKMDGLLQKPIKLSAANALATYRIGYTNIRSDKFEELMLFSCIIFDDDADNNKYVGVYYLSVAFSLSGGKKNSEGIITGAKVSIVGDVKADNCTSARGDRIRSYAAEGKEFKRSINASTVIQSRDLVMQFENGLTHVNMQWDLYIEVKGNNHYPGMSYLVSEKGIIDTKQFVSYWTAGEYRWFHHPYYGVVDRTSNRRSSGPSEVGYAYTKEFETFSDFKFNTSNKWVMANSNYLSSTFSIYFSVDKDVMLAGKKYVLSGGIQDLTDVIPDPRNKTFYIYLDYGDKGPYYRITLTPMAETPTRGLISIVKTNKDSIVSIENQNVFTMNGIRISAVRHGSVIPAATGSIENTGQLEGWVTKNRK